MAIRAFVAVTSALLLCGCHCLRTPQARKVDHAPDLPVVDMNVKVQELPVFPPEDRDERFSFFVAGGR